MLKPILIAAVAAAALSIGAPAIARDAMVRVSHADLNLAKAADARRFRDRIASAVAQVCERPAPGSPDEDRYQACRTATLAALRPGIAQALAASGRPITLAAR